MKVFWDKIGKNSIDNCATLWFLVPSHARALIDTIESGPTTMTYGLRLAS
jgi:hypothetical protein